MKITKSDDMPKGGTPYMPSQYLLDAYEPRRYMRYFEEITRIPHDTEDEAHLAAYIREVAKTAGLESYQDPHGNVLVRMPATEGYENAPAVLFISIGTRTMGSPWRHGEPAWERTTESVWP